MYTSARQRCAQARVGLQFTDTLYASKASTFIPATLKESPRPDQTHEQLRVGSTSEAFLNISIAFSLSPLTIYVSQRPIHARLHPGFLWMAKQYFLIASSKLPLSLYASPAVANALALPRFLRTACMDVAIDSSCLCWARYVAASAPYAHISEGFISMDLL